MYLQLWNGPLHIDGHPGEKSSFLHADGDDHGSYSDEKYHALRNVSVLSKSDGGLCDCRSFRSPDTYALHPGTSGTMGTRIPNRNDRKYTGIEHKLEINVCLRRCDPDYKSGYNKYSDTLGSGQSL